MEPRQLVLVSCMVLLLLVYQVRADFSFQRPWPKTEKDIESTIYKCIPGRTIIKVNKAQDDDKKKVNSDSSEEDGRRSHMNFPPAKDETCKICVCSVSGRDEYCSKRPAKNVNECIKMAKYMKEFQANIPFDHEKILSYMIRRRDYIWHNGEIPYVQNAKCYRSHTYYTNDVKASNTTIKAGRDVNSLLDYQNQSICYYCLCSVSGEMVTCMPRNPYFCEYFRIIRQKDAVRDRYRILFKQDRPQYFSHLSWRLRRKMDEGIYDLISTVGTDGTNSRCVPFVSEYSDCTEENQCSGCTRCTCTAYGEWSCSNVVECPTDDYTPVSDQTIDNAFNVLYSELKNTKPQLRDQQAKSSEDLLLDKDDEIEQKIIALMARPKREVSTKENDTGVNSTKVKFYHTVDEINEDTLKNNNESGTLQAKRVNTVHHPQISRRTTFLQINNISSNPLQIEHKGTENDEQHLTDNKIDTTHLDEIDLSLNNVTFTNYTLRDKDKDLSKLVVNELKGGKEIIGGQQAPIMSNITFTPENDTLTAMAFIAGNLLNRLWNIEKETSIESMETEDLKHQKISDLLELFKEPLTMRQENFLKTALEKLSEAIERKKELKNMTLCEDIENAKQFLRDAENSTWEKVELKEPTPEAKAWNEAHNLSDQPTANQKNATSKAINNINNVLNLIKKFETVNKKYLDTKNAENASLRIGEDDTSNIDNESENIFGKVLEKITKMLLPKKSAKKMANKIRNQYYSKTDADLRRMLKDTYNLDLSNATLTTKDKLILDYLVKLKEKPKCLLDDDVPYQSYTKPNFNIEGDILLNLSEFLKIKSFTDLAKLLEPEQAAKIGKKLGIESVESKKALFGTDATTENIPTLRVGNKEPTTVATTTTAVTHSTEKARTSSNIKENLKLHLKSILDDLQELQREKGIPTKEGQFRIADALPCIYNLINSGTEGSQVQADTDKTTADKIAELFADLKKEVPSKRRSFSPMEPIAKSAVVWERVVKTLDDKVKRGRKNNKKVLLPKSYEEIKILMNEVESHDSNTYKNHAIFFKTLPIERLMLLKTLLADVQQYVYLFNNIIVSLDNFTQKGNEIKKFVDNSVTNIELMEKVLKNLEKGNGYLIKEDKTISLTGSGPFVINKEVPVPKASIITGMPLKNTLRIPDSKIPSPMLSKDGSTAKNSKLSRDDIMNQLIRNRVKLYLKLKEAEDNNLEYDPAYNIGRNILVNLDKGNNRLARELYKVFVNTKSLNTRVPASQKLASQRRQYAMKKEPLIRFDEPQIRQPHATVQDQMVKQLLNMKNMRM